MKKMNFADWIKSDYIPKLNETCLCSDTLEIRYGDGINTWNGLRGGDIDVDVPVTAHNNDTAAHSGIREQINELSSEIADIKDESLQQTPLFANNIEECTDTSKLYVLPDGYIYGYVTKLVNPTNQLKKAIDKDGAPYNGG